MSKFLEQLTLENKRLSGDITGRILSAKLIRPYDEATSLELTLDDGDMLLLRSGLLSKAGKAPDRAKDYKVRSEQNFDAAAWARFGAVELVLDGIQFRLAGVSGNYGQTNTITVTFEDKAASLLRRHKRARSFSRGTNTRAEVFAALCREVKAWKVIFDIPEISTRQPIKGDSAKARSKERKKGLDRSAHLTVKSDRATSEQLDNMEKALAVADEEHASDRATLAMLVAGIGESNFTVVVNSIGYGGVFQGDVSHRYHYFKANDTEGMAKSFLRGGKGFQQGGAIKLARDNPGMSVGEIATRVEASGQPGDFYDQHRTEAEKILEAWGGVGEIKVLRQRYTFRRKKGQSSLALMRDLADEVRFRFFITENVVNYVSDDYLFGLQPVFSLNPDASGFLGVSFDADVGMPIAEMRWRVRKPRWTGRPGIPVTVTGMGPMNGRWLIASVEEDCFEIEPAEIHIRRPAPALPEPAPTKDKIVQTEEDPEAGSTRAELVRQAEWALAHKREYHYSQNGPLLANLRSRPVAGHRFDCSWFVTLVYKAAGAPDPNGGNYRAGGYTGTLAANGEKTNDPQPGDLALYGSSPPYTHVAMYVGDGKCIGIGSEAVGINRHPAKSHPAGFSHFRTYPVD